MWLLDVPIVKNAPPLALSIVKRFKNPGSLHTLNRLPIDYYTWSQTAVFCHFCYSFRKTVILEEIQKVRKIGQNEAFQEEKYND